MMTSISVGDIFSKEFASVNENEVLSQCLDLFKKGTSPVLAVLDEKGKYAGVITRKWTVRARLDPATTKIKTLMRPAPKVEPEVSLSKAAKLMIESGARQLPVFEKEKLVGFVTDEQIIHGAVTQEWGSSPIEQIMTKAPFTLEATRSVGAVLSLFREHDISHVPIMESGRVVGIISTHDIIENIFQPNQRQTMGDIKGEKIQVLSIPAKGVMISPVITVSPGTALKDAESKMHDLNIHCLVVSAKDRLVGIVTKLDFLEPISQMEELDRRLTIQFASKGAVIDENAQGFMMGEFDSFTRKYKDLLESGTLFVYMKLHGTNHKGLPLIHCRLQLRTVKGVRGFFNASAEGFGVEPTFRVALDRLDKRILRSKELAFDPTFAREYIRKYGFPTEEL
ncbi:MAG: CBS domain-containing protein [Candidatus Bathyarchaeota archaeon]|nr:CBS domain-containing protein [Candidatus Bathyarchaeota archaeon]